MNFFFFFLIYFLFIISTPILIINTINIFTPFTWMIIRIEGAEYPEVNIDGNEDRSNHRSSFNLKI